MVSVSVIIPVFRDSLRLRQCLAAIARQTYPADRVEVIVADNGSPDETSVVVAEFRGVRLVVEPSGGSYAARNAALRVARGPAIAFTDSDCIPDPEWLTTGLGALDADAGIGFVAGHVRVTFQEPNAPNLWEALDFVSAFPQESFVRSGFGATANLFARMSVIERVGPFRSDMYSSGDVEWGRRATAAGWRGVYAANAIVSHPARGSWGDCSRKMRRQYHGYLSDGRTFRWRDIIAGKERSIRVPPNLLGLADTPWRIRWRAAVASILLGLLERWVQALTRVVGRPTLASRSVKGW